MTTSEQAFDTKARATCWSITINNPTPQDVRCELPGWVLTGQYEKAPTTGTLHFQGKLKTPQVRGAQVKAVFPRARIEIARNPDALEAYVHKPETRVAEFAGSHALNIFQSQDLIAAQWVEKDFRTYWPEKPEIDWTEKDYTAREDAVLRYVDKLVSVQIAKGEAGLEFTGINPMWRSSWKKFYRAILQRFELRQQPTPLPENIPVQTDRQTDNKMGPDYAPDSDTHALDQIEAEDLIMGSPAPKSVSDNYTWH